MVDESRTIKRTQTEREVFDKGNYGIGKETNKGTYFAPVAGITWASFSWRTKLPSLYKLGLQETQLHESWNFRYLPFAGRTFESELSKFFGFEYLFSFLLIY